MVSTVSDATHRHPDPAADLAASGVISPFATAKTSLRHEYAETEDLVANLASAGRLSADEIVKLAGSTLDRGAAKGLTATGVSALAFLTIGRGQDKATISQAADLFALARLVAARERRPPEHPDLDLQVALAAGRLTDTSAKPLLDAPGLDPWVRWAVRADLVNPFSDPTPAALEAWYSVFDEPFVSRGITPVRIGDVTAPFKSLTTSEQRIGSVDGPLVSIVVPVYANGSDLVTAIRGLVQQTWTNLQVILVDDASPHEHRGVFEEALALDDRVEYLRMPVNGGAYKARNAGIARAKGEIVGIQDADDWSHPERIARQMAVLQAEPTLMATLSKAVRLHDDLRITKIGSFPFERNLPSLLFRREAVLSRLGRFDDVRKAADTEFIARIVAAFGPDSVRTLEEPLALYQLTDGSLSREDFRIGWHRHTRVSYHAAYRYWHRQITEGADPRLDDSTGRTYPTPPELQGVPYPQRPGVVVLADVRATSVAAGGIADELRAIASTTLSLGVARGEALRLGAVNRGYPSAAVAEVIASGTARWVPLVADLATDLLLVRDPDLVSTPRLPDTVRLFPDRVVVVADRMPSPTGARRISYDPERVEIAVRELFDTTTEWLPGTPEIAAALVEAGARGVVHPPHVFEVVTPTRHPRRPAIGRPVIGVADGSRFAAERVRRDDLLTLLPQGADHDVRLLTPGARRVSANWLSFDPTLVSRDELFDQCDFVVGPAPAVDGTNLVRPVLEAMARGCVPVVDPIFRPVLGDAALYYGDHTVAQIVDGLWSDPDAFYKQQHAALTFCRERLSAEVLTSAISRIRSNQP